MRHTPVVVAALALLLLASLPAAAETKAPSRGPSSPASATVIADTLAQALVAKLASPEAVTVLDGLATAQARGSSAAPVAPAIEALLRAGTTLPLAKAALDALGAIGARSSSAVLRSYVHHRVPELRRAAARALGATRGPEALAAFRDGLRSPDGQVRGFSAVGLGTLGAVSALPDLFLALDRGVLEAAPSIGLLCDGETCEKFLTKLGALPLDVMTSGIDPILFRARPFPDEMLISVVERVRDLGSIEAGKYLADVLGRWPEAGSKSVKQALTAAVFSLSKGGK